MIEAGTRVLVGSDDSEFAIAPLVSVEPNGVVYTRVLPGQASPQHLAATGAVPCGPVALAEVVRRVAAGRPT